MAALFFRFQSVNWPSVTNTLPKCQECLILVLSMLFRGAIIWASRKLVSLINHNTVCTTLMQWNIPLVAKWNRVCHCAPGPGQNGPFPYFLTFYISQRWKYICLHFMIDYMYWHSLKIPAKYNDNRLDIFNAGSFFPKLYHFAPTSLITLISAGIPI